MEKKTVTLDSIDAYNKLYGLTTRHPLVTVVDLKKAVEMPNHFRLTYGVYALFLKNGVNCVIKYGRRKYDYQEGTVVTFAPGQTVEVEIPDNEVSNDVIGLLFHPDLIYGTPLGEKISGFDFFDYSQMEAVHLSESEALSLTVSPRLTPSLTIRSIHTRRPSSRPIYSYCSNICRDSMTASLSRAIRSTPRLWRSLSDSSKAFTDEARHSAIYPPWPISPRRQT